LLDAANYPSSKDRQRVTAKLRSQRKAAERFEAELERHKKEADEAGDDSMSEENQARYWKALQDAVLSFYKRHGRWPWVQVFDSIWEDDWFKYDEQWAWLVNKNRKGSIVRKENGNNFTKSELGKVEDVGKGWILLGVEVPKSCIVLLNTGFDSRNLETNLILKCKKEWPDRTCNQKERAGNQDIQAKKLADRKGTPLKSSDKVWRAIHEDNCFQQNDDHDNTNDDTSTPGYCTLEKEQRVYNKIISGLHSSISLHIAHSYCLEMDKDRIAECKTWGKNSSLAYDRVLNHKDRLENLHVVFAIMLRAVQKAGSAITSAVPINDPFFAESLSEWTHNLQPEITKLVESCPIMFDESSLFSEVASGDIEAKRLELKRRFKHLLDIMQCVGCDRCKLWGTLQTLGIGTALRIILDEERETQSTNKLSRQESVALVHTLERFSSALVYTHDLAAK